MRRLSRFFNRVVELRQPWWLLCLSLAAIVPRAVWAAAMWSRQPKYDEASYLQLAKGLCQGLGYVNDNGAAEDFWPVGFPALLSPLTCGHLHATFVLQIVIGLLTTLAVSIVGARAINPTVGRLSGLVYAIYPNHVFYSALALTEPFAALLTLVTVALILRIERGGVGLAVVTGILMAVLILTRPVLTLFPLVACGWLLSRREVARRAVRLSVVMGLVAAAGISPWIVRNHREFGTWTELSANGEYTFHEGNISGALGSFHRSAPALEQLLPKTAYHGGLGYRMGWANIVRDPVGMVQRMPQKLSYFVALETDGALWTIKGLPLQPSLASILILLLASNIAYVCVVAGALLALTRPGAATPWSSLVVWLSVYLAGMSMIYLGDPRYHFVLMPFAVVLFVRAVVTDLPEFRSARRRRDPVAVRWLKRWIAANAVWCVLMLLNLYLKRLELG